MHDNDGGSDRLIAHASDADVQREARRRSRRAFIVGGIAALAGYGGLRWLASQPKVDGALAPLRSVHELNERLWLGTIGADGMASEFARGDARMPRVNGKIGLASPIDIGAWSLLLVVESGAGIVRERRVTLQEIEALPRAGHVTELRCIEGWSQIVQWEGVRFADLAARIALPLAGGASLPPYVSLETPDGLYFVGLDRASALHPQTLLCTGMNGAPLEPLHGAPLRLVTPVKYGIKNIKRIGTIRFTSARPEDYWAKRGYDWYAGL